MEIDVLLHIKIVCMHSLLSTNERLYTLATIVQSIYQFQGCYPRLVKLTLTVVLD